MAFVFPEGLAPEVYPLAWLVGEWQGRGVLAYPGIPERGVVQSVTFDHDGGPYLHYTSTLRLVDDAVVETGASDEVGTHAKASGPAEASGDLAELPVWSTETGYWRVVPEHSPDQPGGVASLEVLLADPAGRVSVYLGVAADGRVDLASDLVARTATAAEVTASKRLYGLVEGRLLWVWELAAFGQPLQSYVSVALDRVDS